MVEKETTQQKSPHRISARVLFHRNRLYHHQLWGRNSKNLDLSRWSPSLCCEAQDHRSRSENPLLKLSLQVGEGLAEGVLDGPVLDDPQEQDSKHQARHVEGQLRFALGKPLASCTGPEEQQLVPAPVDDQAHPASPNIEGELLCTSMLDHALCLQAFPPRTPGESWQNHFARTSSGALVTAVECCTLSGRRWGWRSRGCGRGGSH